MKLNVVARTYAGSGIPTNKKRIVDDDREILVSKCLKSLAISCENCNADMEIAVTILDDGSDESYINRLKEYYKNLSVEIIHCDRLGFNGTSVKQFEWAKNNPSDFVYLVEDDYFHAPNAIQTMIDGYFHLRTLAPLFDTAIFPMDAPDRYFRDPMTPSLLVQHVGYHWRTITHTSQTVFMPYPTFLRMYDLFDLLGKGYGNNDYGENILEDTTINRIWSNLTNKHGQVVLWSPIPSVALHMSFEDVPILNTNLTDWKKDWAELSI
jgi:glycosyltransferase involved in cell wall biosynthesis